MAIQFPLVGAIVYVQFTPTDTSAIITAVQSTLVSAGWSSQGLADAINVSFNGQPNDGETITVDGTTYRFKNTPSQTNDVQIGANAAATAANFAAATFTLVTSSLAGSVVKLTQNTTGSGAGSILTYSSGLSNVSIAWASARGYLLTCAATQHGLKAVVYVQDTAHNTTDRVNFVFASTDGVASSTQDYRISVAAGRTLEMRACAHEFEIWLIGNTGTNGTSVGMSVPYLHGGQQVPVTVSNVSGSGTVTVTTSSALGLSAGSDVFISEVGGMTGVNGFHTIATISGTTFTYSGTTTGSYTGGGLVAGPGQLARCFFGWSNNSQTFRSNISVDWAFVCANQYSYDYNTGNSSSTAQFLIVRKLSNGPSRTVFWGNFSILLEPIIGWGSTGTGSTWVEIGQMWAAFLVTDDIAMDQIKLAYKSHDWVNFSDGPTQISNVGVAQTLWLAKN